MMQLSLDHVLPSGRLFTDRFYSACLAVAVHGLVFGVGALGLVRSVEYGMDASNGMAEVDLIAAPAVVSEAPATPPPAPIAPDDVAEPVKTQAPAPAAPAMTPISAPSTGADTTTMQHTGSSGSFYKPGYYRNPSPPYPEEARRLKQEGRAILELHVTAEGKVSASRLKQTSGFPLLDEAALKGVQIWQFRPATVGGLRVETVVDVPIRFKLN